MSSHFRMDDLLQNPTRVETAFRDGGQLLVSVAEAMKLREHLRGAIWTAETIRLTTDVARVIYQGGEMATDMRNLQAFAGSLVFDGPAAGTEAVSATVIVLVIAAAAVIGFAISHLDTTLPDNLTLRVEQRGGDITIAVA